MPTEFNEEIRAVYGMCNGEMFKFGNITNMNITPTTLEEDDVLSTIYEGQSATFTGYWFNPNSKAYKCMLRRQHRGTNNWRKMHGLPLRRYS